MTVKRPVQEVVKRINWYLAQGETQERAIARSQKALGHQSLADLLYKRRMPCRTSCLLECLIVLCSSFCHMLRKVIYGIKLRVPWTYRHGVLCSTGVCEQAKATKAQPY